MKNKLTLLLALVISLGIIVFVVLRLPNQTKTQTQIQQKSNSSVSYQPQINEKGSVVVEATPLSLSAKDNVSFSVTLTTHSGDLDYDLLAISKLTDNKGNVYSPLSWTGGRGGHHISGKLTFPKLSQGALSVILTISKIDNQDRVFIWDLK